MGTTNNNEDYFNPPAGLAAEEYARLQYERVIIYYQDQRGIDRTIIGKITEIDGDKMWLENVNKRTGELWRGVINCANCKIGVISTLRGWGLDECERHEIAEDSATRF